MRGKVLFRVGAGGDLINRDLIGPPAWTLGDEEGPLNSASFAITSIVIGTFALAEMSVERVLFTRPRRQGHVPRRTRTLDRLGRLFSPDNVAAAAAAAAVMREMMTANDEEEDGRRRAKIEARLVGGI